MSELTIATLVRLSGTDRETINNWRKRGLFKPHAPAVDGQWQRFSFDDAARLVSMATLIRGGVSASDASEFTTVAMVLGAYKDWSTVTRRHYSDGQSRWLVNGVARQPEPDPRDAACLVEISLNVEAISQRMHDDLAALTTADIQADIAADAPATPAAPKAKAPRKTKTTTMTAETAAKPRRRK